MHRAAVYPGTINPSCMKNPWVVHVAAFPTLTLSMTEPPGLYVGAISVEENAMKIDCSISNMLMAKRSRLCILDKRMPPPRETMNMIIYVFIFI